MEERVEERRQAACDSFSRFDSPTRDRFAQAGSFTPLSLQNVQAIVAQLVDDTGPQLVTDTRALQSLSTSCRAFADLFRCMTKRSYLEGYTLSIMHPL